MSILVTGGAGYIGSHTVRLLGSLGLNIVVIDNLVYGHRESILDDNVSFYQGDVGDTVLLNHIFNQHKISAVIHFSAYAYVGESVLDPIKYYENNVAHPLNLLEVMQKWSCRHFIFSSTCATYGIPDTLPITEDTPQNPINPYGHSKLTLEKILEACETAWGLKSVCLRYFNACGSSSDAMLGESHDPETHLIPLILDVALGKRDHIKVYGSDYDTPDGTCIRDYIHVEDLASAHVKAYEYLREIDQSLKCNLGTGQGYSVKEVISHAEEITQREIKIINEERRDGDPPVLIADPSLAKEKLRWVTQKSSLKNILQTAWNWHQAPRY